MKALACCALLAALAQPGAADDEASHPSDYTLALERGPSEGWDDAVSTLLGDDDALPTYAISSVARRFHALTPPLQRRVLTAFARNRRHPATVTIYLELQERDHPADPEMKKLAREALYEHRGPGAMDALRQLSLTSEGHRVKALAALVRRFIYHATNVQDPFFNGVIDPLLDPASPPGSVFDNRFIDAVDFALSDSSTDRLAVLTALEGLDTPGTRSRLSALMSDSHDEVRLGAAWALAKLRDRRGCDALTDRFVADADTGAAGELALVCGPDRLVETLRRYRASDSRSQAVLRAMIEAWTTPELLELGEPAEAVLELGNDADPFLRQTAAELSAWREQARKQESRNAQRAGVKPLLLVGVGFIALIVGLLLFVWAWRLLNLATRTRNRPVSRIASLAMGPVALEGEVQPAGKPLRHPLTGEPCIYYAGADRGHPTARFYIEDGTGRVLVDPRGAVLFSDDGVLVPGERVHVVGLARHDEAERARLLIAEDRTPQPLYRRAVEAVIQLVFGFGGSASVTRMLFSDPTRCFWIWDDLERRPMGEARDMLWIAASVLAAGVWMTLFAVSVLALLDQEVSATLARAFEAGL